MALNIGHVNHRLIQFTAFKGMEWNVVLANYVT